MRVGRLCSVHVCGTENLSSLFYQRRRAGGGAFDNRVTLIFDLLTQGLMQAEVLP